MEPTIGELARQIEAVERRTHNERNELRDEMRTGFLEIKAAIEAGRGVAPDLFVADQRRQDHAIKALESEFTWLKRTVLFGVALIILVEVVFRFMH